MLARIREDHSSLDQVRADYAVLLDRRLNVIKAKSKEEMRHFVHAPVIVARKDLRDRLNIAYYFIHGERAPKEIQERLWLLPPKTTGDYLGRLPLVIGMPVIIIKNIAISLKVVNGM